MSFTPKTPKVSNIAELNIYLQDLERRIYEAFQTGEFDSINLRLLAIAPDKPRDGDVINADGNNYDPGSGKGLYYYNQPNYEKL